MLHFITQVVFIITIIIIACLEQIIIQNIEMHTQYIIFVVNLDDALR